MTLPCKADPCADSHHSVFDQWCSHHEDQDEALCTCHQAQGRELVRPACIENLHYIGSIQEGYREGWRCCPTRNHKGHGPKDEQQGVVRSQ